jgi:hypothetical protein
MAPHRMACQRFFARKQFFSPAKTAALTVRLRDTSTAETRLFTKVTVLHRQDDGPVAHHRAGRREQPESRAVPQQDAFFKSFYLRPAGFAGDHPLFSRTGATDTAAGRFSPRRDRYWRTEMAGVVYHSIGVNGAKFSDFVRARYFARQLADLNPDLDRSLLRHQRGTGETHRKPCLPADGGVGRARLKKYAPNAYISCSRRRPIPT